MRFLTSVILVPGLLLASLVRAEPATNVQVEVNFLLGYIEGSGCDFYRNGTRYDSKAAQVHLRGKYKYLVAGNLMATTEDFIERAATESSFTGQPYEVKCNGGPSITSNQWLRDELARFRSF